MNGESKIKIIYEPGTIQGNIGTIPLEIIYQTGVSKIMIIYFKTWLDLTKLSPAKETSDVFKLAYPTFF